MKEPGASTGVPIASMWKLVLAAIIEVSYVLITRTWLRRQAYGVELEILTSVIRAMTAVAYWLLLRDLIMSRRPRAETLRQPMFLTGALVILLVPVLTGQWWFGLEPLAGPRILFALTSIVVGIREEFFYRGILQNLLESKVELPQALLASNALFTVYHYGAQPFTLEGIIGLFTMGCVQGLIYSRSGSILAVITLHAVYDAPFAFSPFLADPLAAPWGIPLQFGGLVILWVWSGSPGVKPQSEA